MFSTLITTTLLRAGFRACYSANPSPKPGPVEPVFEFGNEFDPAVFENAVALYVPSIGKCVQPGEEGWPEDEATGLLTADVFMVEQLIEIAPHSDTWGVDFMAEGSWEDVKNAAPELYAIVAQSFADWEVHEQKKYEQRVRNYRPQTIPPREPELFYRCEFIGLWQEEKSLDRESGHWEVDCVDFIGEGKIVPIENQPDAPSARADLVEKHLDLLG